MNLIQEIGASKTRASGFMEANNSKILKILKIQAGVQLRVAYNLSCDTAVGSRAASAMRPRL
jgi:hypothetical protein